MGEVESNMSLWEMGVYVSKVSVVHEESCKYKAEQGVQGKEERQLFLWYTREGQSVLEKESIVEHLAQLDVDSVKNLVHVLFLWQYLIH